MTKHSWRRLWRSFAAAAMVLSLGVSATACASGGAGGGGESADVLNVGQISDSISFFPLYVAEENGYFDDEGVTLGERPRLGTGAKLGAALTSGSIDVAAGVITDAFNLHENNDNTRITGSLVTEYYVDIIVGDDFEDPGADAPLEERVQSLVGKNIGITGPGSGTEALVKHLFGTIDKNPSKDSTLVNLGASTTGAIGALSEGQVDALAFFQPVGQMAESQGVGEIYVSPQRGDIPEMAGQLHGTLFSTTTAIDNKPEQIQGFNKAIDSALGFIADNPDDAAKLLKTYLKATDQDTVDALIKLLPEEMATSTTVPEDGYEKAVDFHIDSGLIPEGLAYSDIVWGEVKE
jgi:NitT/TauT family transport system substrate-binding protein